MKASVPADPVESITPKPGTKRGVPEKFLCWFAQVGAVVKTVAKHFLRSRHPASQFTAEQRAESNLEEAGVIAAATENAVLTTTKSFTVPVTAELKVHADAQIDSAASTVPDQEEIQRRRNLVRMLFNDFWSGAHDKPAAFVERLDQAEDYVNERLTACGEFWRLDANTRVMLSLPPRARIRPITEKIALHADKRFTLSSPRVRERTSSCTSRPKATLPVGFCKP
jgi:hypothetical protein